jgi:hypothetical protein
MICVLKTHATQAKLHTQNDACPSQIAPKNTHTDTNAQNDAHNMPQMSREQGLLPRKPSMHALWPSWSCMSCHANRYLYVGLHAPAVAAFLALHLSQDVYAEQRLHDGTLVLLQGWSWHFGH